MSRYTGPKARLCRREGFDLFGRPKYAKVLERKPLPPGQQVGHMRRGKRSEYSVQLREKQKLRLMFGLSEKQFRNYFMKAVSQKGLTGDIMMQLLEMRLDNVLYRAGYALTRMQSRQMAGHGHFLVNGRRVDVPSYSLRVGDKIELRPKLKNSTLYSGILEENKSYKPSRWLKVNQKNLEIEVMATPDHDDFDAIVDTQKIIEFYSR